MLDDDIDPESKAAECLRLVKQKYTDPGSRTALLTMAQRWFEWASNRKNLRGDALLPENDTGAPLAPRDLTWQSRSSAPATALYSSMARHVLLAS